MIPQMLCCYVHEAFTVNPSAPIAERTLSTRVMSFLIPSTHHGYTLRGDEWAGLRTMPTTPTEHHAIIVRMHKMPVGTRLVLGVFDWDVAASFLEMSAHVLSAFDNK